MLVNSPRQSYRGGNFSLLSHYHSSSSRSSCLAIINCCQNISLVPQTLPQACLSHKNNLLAVHKQLLTAYTIIKYTYRIVKPCIPPESTGLTTNT